MSLPARIIEDAYLGACLEELTALKPGNVHVHAPAHDTTPEDFRTSARVSAPFVAQRGAGVGQRILGAIRATRAAVASNTNLGIVLLAAPLAAAAERVQADQGEADVAALRRSLRAVLGALTVADATLAFEAIALASPAGLGAVDADDVRKPATMTLLAAMAAAAERDRVAAQYASAFADIFELGLPALQEARYRGETGMWPAISVFMKFAGAMADSHVARKYGTEPAEALRARMAATAKQLERLDDPAEKHALLLQLDRQLKGGRLNPGTSADLTVATLFTDRLARNLAV